jgi:hypothetical protein
MALSRLVALILLLISNLLARVAAADTWIQKARLTASDGAAWDNLGWSVAVGGDIVVVGAAGDDARKGSVYIFTRPGPGWTDMTQTAKLTASDGAAGHRFGVSVALSGDTLIVGASGGPGVAYVFQKPAGGWEDMTQTAKLTASDGAADDQFGWSVAISGATVVVGADLYDVSGNNGNFDQGAAYVFVKPGAGWTNMTQTAKLTASDGGTENYFGASVTISGDTVVVGAEGAVFPGAAYVFLKPGAGWTNMTRTAKLTASDGVMGDQFGGAVAISGDTVAVGAPVHKFWGNERGAAYVFAKPPGGWSNMTQTAKLTASDGRMGDYLGGSVAISGDTVIAGAADADVGGKYDQGAAYVFAKPGTGWTNMTETAKLTAGDGAASDQFGHAVGVAGNTMVIGAYGDDGDKGSAYIMQAEGGIEHRLYLPLVLRSGAPPSLTTTASDTATHHPPQAVIPPASIFLLYSREDDTIWLKNQASHAKLMDGARPRLSPDGRYIAHQDEAIFGDLYIHDLQTGQATKVYTSSTHLLVASWTPDGNRVVFDHGCRIYTVNRDGSGLAVLIDTWPGSQYCYNDSPDVNPVDGRIAWENEKYGLGVAGADGANPYWAPNTQPRDYSPRWSPDGQWLAFWRANNAFKIRPDGTGLTQLTSLPAGNWLEDTGQWTPDGHYLVAAGQVNGAQGLYAVATDGSGQLALLVPRAWQNPDWVGSVGYVQFRLYLPLVLRR